MPILGIIASQDYVRTPPSSYESIATVSVGSGGSSTITFSSIPSTYKHLQIRWIGRITAATTDENLQIQVGNTTIDTSSNYSQHILYGTGAGGGGAFGNASITGSNLGRLTGASTTAGIFAVGVIDILDYANTSKYKTFRGLSGHDQNGSGIDWFASGAWYNTGAINTIQFNQLYGSGVFAQYSQFALYGIKA